MKKIILLLVLISNFCFSQVIATHTFERYSKDKNGNSIVVETYTYTQYEAPNYQKFKEDIASDTVFAEVSPTINAIKFTTFLDYVNSCINGKADGSKFKFYWDKMDLQLSDDQKKRVNKIFKDNYFAIQL